MAITGTVQAQNATVSGSLTAVSLPTSSLSSPLSVPTPKDVKVSDITARDPVGSTRDPWENIGQFDDFGGDWWEWVITIPKFSKGEIQDAKDWSGFLTALQGQKHHFKMGPRFDDGVDGAASGETDIKVKTVSDDKTVVRVKNMPTSTSDVLVRGDWISVDVTGGGEELKKVTATTSSDSNGFADVDIWPKFRKRPSPGDAVELSSPEGPWRIAKNQTNWSWRIFTQQEISLALIEAVEELI